MARAGTAPSPVAAPARRLARRADSTFD